MAKFDQFRTYLDKQLKQCTISLPDDTPQFEVILDMSVEVSDLDNNFLQTLKKINPRYTGWPFWVILFNADDESKPKASNNDFYAFLNNLKDTFSSFDFWFIQDKRMFYQLRVENIWKNKLNLVVTVLRLAEIIETGLVFAKELTKVNDLHQISFDFRWSNLKKCNLYIGMQEVRRFNLTNHIDDYYKAKNDEFIIRNIRIPISTSRSIIYKYIDKIIAALLSNFDKADKNNLLTTHDIQNISDELLTRNLRK